MSAQPTTEEELKLRAFHRQFDRIRNSSIGKQGKVKISSTTKFDFTTGQIDTVVEGFDPELFQAQLPVLRQFILNDDISFNHICNIICKTCDRPELLAWVKEARRRWKENLATLPDAMHQHLHKTTDSLEDALKKLFYGYGGLFHIDIHAPEQDCSVAEIERLVLHRAFPFLCWCLNVIDSVIYWWLDAPHETVPAIPIVQPPSE